MNKSEETLPPWLHGKYGLKRKLKLIRMPPYPTWRFGPEILQIETQNRCNLKCSYCNVESYHNNDFGEMPIPTFIQILKEAKKLHSVEKVYLFMNGEYLLEKRGHVLTKLVKKILGCITVTYTNGTIYENREILRDNNLDEVHFTVSASTKETYKRVHCADLFDTVLKTVDWLDENRYKNQLMIINFILIAYNFLILQIPFLENLFSNILVFAFVGCICYIPVAVLLGHLHNTRQLETDITVQSDKNPYYKLILERLDEIEKAIKIERYRD